MHLFRIIVILIVVTLLGVEFSVAAFVNPAARRLDPQPQMEMLRRLALVLGKVMPIWYPVCALLLGLQTWFDWHMAGLAVLLAADVLWLLASVGGILFLVPLNARIAAGDADWQRIHRVWDQRHRIRTAGLAVAATLLIYVIAR